MPYEVDRPSARAVRLDLTLQRDGEHCVWCGRAFTGLVAPTREHLVPRAKGGPSWQENELAACRRCNRDRGHQPVVPWLQECLRRGWSPDTAAVERSLRALGRAIAERGGQRRARAYVDGQLRRLPSIAEAGTGGGAD